ncbi:MAG: histidine kinase [Lachnospiraceae bacterium]|nr:histidine kinase [Lachnospiraceae bacterium]
MFHHMIQRYRSYGIAKKILIILLCGATIPFLLTDVIITLIAINTVTSQTESLIESNLNLSEKGLEDYFTEYDNIIMDIYTDNRYAANLECLNVWDSRNYYGVKRQLEDSLQNIAYLHPEILGMAFVSKKRDCIMYDSITNSSLNSVCFPSNEKDWLNIAESTFSNTETIYSDVINREEEEYSGNVIYLAHRIADINNYGQGTAGSVIICLDERSIRAIYSQDDESTLSFLCNERGNVISSTQEELLGSSINLFGKTDQFEESIKQILNEKHLMNTNYYSIFKQSVLVNKFTIISIRNDMELLKNFQYIFEVSILFTLLILSFSFLIMVRFANSLQNSVGEITEAMDKAYKGDYTVQIVSSRQDEFGKIGRHFNHMVQKIDQSGKMEKEALIKEKNAEIRSLEAQINPHFLYNTLDAINWIAIENEQFQISKMLKDLATILRYSCEFPYILQ